MNIKCKAYSSYEDFISLKEQWPEFNSRYYETDYEYLSSLYKENIFDGKPLTMLLTDSAGKYVIINGIIEDVKYSPKIAYFTLKLIRFKKRCFLIRPYSILGEINNNMVARDIEAALSIYCRKNDIDYVYFNLLSRESIFVKYLSTIKNPLKRDPASLLEEHFLLEIPESLEGYFKTKDAKSRYNLKRMMKQLENTYKENITIRIFTEAEDVEVFCEHAEIISQKSHLRPINAGFRSTPAEIKKKKILANIGFFRSYILYLKEKPAAFISGIIYKRSFLTEHIGFDIQYERLSIGSYLLLKAIEDIASNKCADIIDYSYGSDSYKKRFSSLFNEDIRIRLFIPKISNLFFMMNIAFFTAITNLTRKMLKKTGMYTKIRKTVRNMLRASRNI
jgi:Acetyltransferase (GNAT) domain